MCTELIAREMGVVITDARGKRLSAPMDVEADIAWAGYANHYIQKEIEPLMQRALARRGLLDDIF
jgi:hypothetical protein